MEPKQPHLAKHQPATYRIVVREPLDGGLSAWFAGMTVHIEISADGAPTTVLMGRVVDQAALRGLLTKIWNLNLTVISVSRIEAF